MNKSNLRKKLLSKRLKVKNRRAKELDISRKLKLVINNSSLVVAGYQSVKSEVDPSIFLNFLLKNNFSICLPYIEKVNSHLLFREFKKKTKLIKGKYNIMHPDNTILLQPNIIIIPLVGFDTFKNRIGYGGGYYDRTIAYLEKKNQILKLGIAFDEQETDKISVEKYDKRLDVVITPSRLILWKF